MPILPNDILIILLSHVQTAQDLFSCLTLDKSFFPLAAAVLYYDPLKYFDKLKPDAKRALLRWLLTLSPIDDTFSNQLRFYLQAERQPFRVGGGSSNSNISSFTAAHAPSIDYLSLVRVFQWRQEGGSCFTAIFPTLRFHAQSLGLDERVYHLHVRDTLMQAICGHQLDRIVKLEIEARRIHEFVDRIPSFTQLKSLCIQDDFQEDPAMLYQEVIRLVQAFQQTHGMDQLQTCYFSHNPLYDPETMLASALELYSLLPPAERLPGYCPLDADLARIKWLSISNTPSSPWLALSQQFYPNETSMEILERCHQLTEMFIIASPLQTHLYEWTADMARRRQIQGESEARVLSLEKLSLVLQQWGENHSMGLVEDALIAFAPTLQKLDVLVIADQEVVAHRLALPQDINMPRLCDVALKHTQYLDFDPRFLEQSPVHTLRIRFVRQPEGGDHEGHAQETISLSTWPVLHMLHLTTLEISDGAIRPFNPASFNHMPMLKDLTLMCSSDGAALEDEAAADQLPASISTSWTWDWHLPNLNRLSLQSLVPQYASHTCELNSFSFRFLQSCPRLEVVDLRFRTLPPHLWAVTQPHPSEDSSQPPQCQSQHQQQENETLEQEPSFPSVKWLRLTGKWASVADGGIGKLRELLMSLTRLEMFDVDLPDGLEVDVLRATHNHPSLYEVSTVDRNEWPWPTHEDAALTAGMVQLRHEYEMLCNSAHHPQDDETSSGGTIGQSSLAGGCLYKISRGHYRLSPTLRRGSPSEGGSKGNAWTGAHEF